MKRKGMIYLGGPYDSPHYKSGSVAEQHARRLFFVAVREVAPEVLEHLRDEVYTEYLRGNPDNHWFGWAELQEPIKQLPQKFGHLDVLEAELKDWGKRFYLTEDWAFDLALGTMRFWSVETSIAEAEHLDPQPLVLATGGLRTRLEDNKTFEMVMDSLMQKHTSQHWMLNLNLHSHRETIREWFERIKQEIDGLEPVVKNYLEERGVNEVPKKESFDHFIWAALRQIHGYSPELIGEALNLNKLTVRKGIVSVLELMAWEPRELPKGRRKNSKGKSYLENAVEHIHKLMKDSEKYYRRRHLL